MAFPQGIYFRATDNQTDPTDYDAEVSATANYPRTSAQGNNVGWETSNLTAAVDRDVTTDVRLKGIHYGAHTSTHDYRIDLPSTGSYNVRAALGDSGFSHAQRIRVLDTTTSLADNSSSGDVPSNQWMDATGVVRTTESDWVNNNAAITGLSFSTTILRFRLGGHATPSDPNFTVNAVHVAAAAGGSVGPLIGGKLLRRGVLLGGRLV